MKKDKGICKDSLWACLCELVEAKIIIEGSMEEDTIAKRIKSWKK